MDECLQCQTELVHTPGRKKKKFCNAKCKNDYSNEHNPLKKVIEYCKEKGITIDELLEQHLLAFTGLSFKQIETAPKRFDLISKKPIVNDLNKTGGSNIYNPMDNPAHKNDIEIVVGGRNSGKKLSYLEQRRQEKNK